jgi:hypothetical protein
MLRAEITGLCGPEGDQTVCVTAGLVTSMADLYRYIRYPDIVRSVSVTDHDGSVASRLPIAFKLTTSIFGP